VLKLYLFLQIKVEAIVAQKNGVSPRLPRPKSIPRIRMELKSQE
jgi:hypothetical protein